MALITTTKMVFLGDLSLEENPLPILAEHPLDMKIEEPESSKKFHGGEHCAPHRLPYLLQDRYKAFDATKKTTVDVIVLQNDHLKAILLPSLGGRLYSLTRLSDGKELVYKNNAIQFSNIAICNAWFAGGIEWNIGHLGHHCDTSRALEAYTNEKEGVVRLLGFERREMLAYTMDFRLEGESLYNTVMIYNPDSYRKNLYWWTNAAIEETEDTRVFSSSKNALFRDMTPGTFKLFETTLPSISPYAEEASFPRRLINSTEYFFNCSNTSPLWEVASIDEKNSYLEYSTKELAYKKLFCWGNAQGGETWNRFLIGNAHYCELQAGLAPSQLHSADIEGEETISFTQGFSFLSTNDSIINDDYDTAQAFLTTLIQQRADVRDLETNHAKWTSFAKESTEFRRVFESEGWGYLDSLKRKKELPLPWTFEAPLSTEGPIQPWKNLIEKNSFSHSEELSLYTYQTDPFYLPLLKTQNHWYARFQQALILYENNQVPPAIELLEALSEKKAIILRTLAQMHMKTGNTEKAVVFWKKCRKCDDFFSDIAYAEEYADFFSAIDYLEAKNLIESLPPEQLENSDMLYISYLQIAAKEGNYDFVKEKLLSRNFINIREGKTLLSDLYTEVTGSTDIPAKIDFRMNS